MTADRGDYEHQPTGVSWLEVSALADRLAWLDAGHYRLLDSDGVPENACSCGESWRMLGQTEMDRLSGDVAVERKYQEHRAAALLLHEADVSGRNLTAENDGAA